MSTQLLLRRGTTAQTAAFTGASGEVTVDTTKKTLVVHDGINAGGTPLANTSDIVSAVTSLGFTPYNATNPSGFISGISGSNVTDALGFTPYNASNPAGYQTSVEVAATVAGTPATSLAGSGWAVTLTGTKLYFTFNGTNVGSLDSAGNFIALGNITAYGTV